ncbi:hypothetical protein [Deinococcus aestuarii]|uniref:hypothetical protein n=1 Tax=Deinococcus aestuarii TaxID=2774531 RepID=UPI001C0CF2CF|nr:hypothetical protein [Deinococcus aestuarii]
MEDAFNACLSVALFDSVRHAPAVSLIRAGGQAKGGLWAAFDIPNIASYAHEVKSMRLVSEKAGVYR